MPEFGRIFAANGEVAIALFFSGFGEFIVYLQPFKNPHNYKICITPINETA